MVEHLTARNLGAGDLSILVERDRYRTGGAFGSVQIWTIDAGLDAYCST